MLKKRIIPKFLLKNGRLVKGVHFHDNFREAGNPVTTSKVYNDYGVDELIFLDIQPSNESRNAVCKIIENVSEEVFMPFTAGGGIKTIEGINNLLRSGADKISINTFAVENPNFIKEAAKVFGNQCIIISVDYKEVEKGLFRVFIRGGHEATDIDPVEWALKVQDNNCGEILLSSIDRDGTMSGYDLEMIHSLSERLEIPLIASSGAGSLQDCIDAFDAGASAITISSMFIFTDHSPIKVRSYLYSQNVNVRASKSSRS
jgi:imidazole glycerol-phosphate synthase subunit HisF